MARMSGTRGDNYKQSTVSFLKAGTCLQEAIPWEFRPYQEIVEIKVQALDLVHLLVSLNPRIKPIRSLGF